MSLEIPAIPYHHLLHRVVERLPAKTALWVGDQSISFAQLDALSNQAAHWLASLGVQRGDRVALALYNSLEYVATFYGAIKLGAVVVPVNASYQAEEANHILEDAGVKVLLAGDKLANRLPGRALVRQRDWRAAVSSRPETGPSTAPLNVDEDLAVLQYSSGTTGRPRGVMMTHHNLVASHLQYQHAGEVTEADTSILFVPLVHVYGTMLLGGALAAGATVVLMERYHLETSVQLVERHRVTLYYCTTAVVMDLVQSGLATRYDLSSLRYINSGGAPLPAEVRRRARRELRIPIANGYGMTEAPIVGHLVPGEERRIVGPDGTDVAKGERGEIWVRGPQVMKGYWNDPQGTAEVLRDGWLRTGDIGCIDEQGRLQITARHKEIIKYKGFAVSPTELEGLLLEEPSVCDCAVVGQPQQDGNELPKAFVVLRNGGDAAAAVQAVNQRVAEYKKIRSFEVVTSIPRNDAGKILRRLLKT